jgi:excisionase family DNA binding protein
LGNTDSEDSFLTVADVAEKLKLNQQTVRNWIDQGSLPAVRVGRRVRIRRSDFERVLEEGYTGAVGSGAQNTGPTAEDFWGGEAVGLAEPASAAAHGSAGTSDVGSATRDAGSGTSDVGSATPETGSGARDGGNGTARGGDDSQGNTA